MILLLAVMAGLLAGGLRAWIGKRRYQPIQLRHVWLVVVAFLLQWLAFFLPATRVIIPNWLAALLLIVSLLLLLVFVFMNANQPGLLVLGLGLVMNLMVILANGGFMPISPENAGRLVPQYPAETWQSGNRFGRSKDIVLLRDSTRLWFLSDRYLSPPQFSYRFSFSLGDVLVAVGAFWVFWQGGGPNQLPPQQGSERSDASTNEVAGSDSL